MITSFDLQQEILENRKLDDDLCTAVKAALRSSGYSVLRHVEATVSRGVVVLCGRVPSFHMKQIAQTEALRMPRVNEVDNRLDVRYD